MVPSECGFRHFSVKEARVIGPAVLAVRVSSPKQKWGGNLDEAERFLRDRIGSVEVRGVVKKTMTSQSTAFAELVAGTAKKLGAKLVIAESMDRIYRPTAWSVHWQDEWYHAGELADLKALFGDIVVMTLVHPDASSSEVRSAQRKRGWKMKQGKQRKYKKPLRDALKTKVLRMRRNGRTIKDIADSTGVPYQTMYRWIRSAEAHRTVSLA